jgi:hypothetical protein
MLLRDTGRKHLLVHHRKKLNLLQILNSVPFLFLPSFVTLLHLSLCFWVILTKDAVSMYGLSPETVNTYVSMGFSRDLVVEKMRKLNIRSLTSEETQGEKGGRLLEELLSAST